MRENFQPGTTVRVRLDMTWHPSGVLKGDIGIVQAPLTAYSRVLVMVRWLRTGEDAMIHCLDLEKVNAP